MPKVTNLFLQFRQANTQDCLDSLVFLLYVVVVYFNIVLLIQNLVCLKPQFLLKWCQSSHRPHHQKRHESHFPIKHRSTH